MGILSWLFGQPPEYLEDSVAAADEPAAADEQALKLHVGDVVGFDGNDYQIEQKYIYSSGGYKWYTYHLLDKATGKTVWLNAELDDELELGTSEDIAMTLPQHIPTTIKHNGVSYGLSDHGHAEVTIWNAGHKEPVQASVEYWDFDGPDDVDLGVERWDDATQASLDRSIKPYELTIYPKRVPREG